MTCCTCPATSAFHWREGYEPFINWRPMMLRAEARAKATKAIERQRAKGHDTSPPLHGRRGPK